MTAPEMAPPLKPSRRETTQHKALQKRVAELEGLLATEQATNRRLRRANGDLVDSLATCRGVVEAEQEAHAATKLRTPTEPRRVARGTANIQLPEPRKGDQ